MRRGADHAIVKRQPHPLRGGEMRVNDFCISMIRQAQGAKEPFGLSVQIHTLAYRKQIACFQMRKLFIVAQDGAMNFFLFLL